MIRLGIGAGIGIACSFAGCGGMVTHDPPDTQTGTGSPSDRERTEPGAVEGLCVSAGWTQPAQPVAIGFALDTGFSLVRADGSRELLISTPESYNSISWASIDRERYFAVRLAWDTNGETRIRGTTFTRDGTPTWELDEAFSGVSQLQTFRMSPWGATLVADDGTQLLLPSGERRFLPGFVARTPANPSGWVLGFTDEERGAQGWIRLGDSDVRPLSLPLVPPFDPDDSPTQNAHLHVFTLVYLGQDGSSVDIVVEQAPDLVSRYPTGVLTSNAPWLEQVSSDVYLLHVAGVPRFALKVSSEHLVRLDLPADVSDRDDFASSESHLVVVRDGRPTWRVDLADGASAPFLEGVATDPAAITDYLFDGPYIAAKGRSAPLWVVDAGTGAAWVPGAALDLVSVFATSACGSESALLEDGTTAFAIRNAETGGLAVSDSSGRTTTVGVEHTRFDGLPTVDRVGRTWTYTTRGLEDCAPSEPWLPDVESRDGVVSGAAAVVVPPAGAPFVFPGAAVAPVHESGWCTFNDGIVYDLGTREEREVDTKSLRWLDETF